MTGNAPSLHHAVRHAPGGPDSLAAYYASATVYTGNGTADTSGLLAAFNSMKTAGIASGTLLLGGKVAIDTALVFDGGYSNPNPAGIGSDAGGQFILDTSGATLVPAANVGTALTIKNFYAPRVDTRFFGGGAYKTTTGTASSSSNPTHITLGAAQTMAVGQFVRLEGSGLNGEVPTCGRIITVTDSTHIIIDKAVLTSVTGTVCKIMDVGLHLEGVVNPQIDSYAAGFAGLHWHGDDLGASATAIQTAYIRRLVSKACGMGIYQKADIGDFGEFANVLDSANTDGVVFANSADVTLTYFENFSPATQTVGVLFDQCGVAFHAKTLYLGDRATDSLAKAVGAGANSTGPTFGDLYLTGFMPGANPTINGLQLVDIGSAVITGSVQTNQLAKPLWLRGAGIKGKMQSLGSDGNVVYIDAGHSVATPKIDLDIKSFFNQLAPIVITSAITGGELDVRGTIDTPNNLANAAVALAVQDGSTGGGMIIDVAGLHEFGQSVGVGSIATTNYDNIRKVEHSTLSKVFRYGIAPQTFVTSLTSGTSVVNGNRKMTVGLKIDTTAAAVVTVAVFPTSGFAGAGLTRAISPAAAESLSFNFDVPPFWSFIIVLGSGATFDNSFCTWYLH